MAVTRTVLPRKGFIQPQHGLTGYEQDMDSNLSLLDTNVAFASDLVQNQNANPSTVLAGPGYLAGVPIPAAAPPTMRALTATDLPLSSLFPLTLAGMLGINGLLIGGLAGYGLKLMTSATLTPGWANTGGYMLVQGQLYMPTGVVPSLPAAPASSTSYLFYSTYLAAGSHFYYSSNPYGTHLGDAMLAIITTSATAVTAVTAATAIGGIVAAAPSAAGNFTVPHLLGRKPVVAIIYPTSSAAIYWQTPTAMDLTNLYLVASAAGTANVQVF